MSVEVREPECRSPATREASPEASTGGPNSHRLAQLTTAYDPENVFHFNPNVKPAV
jgi:Berberine and berberine like